MLRIFTWDEIGCEWGEDELDIPATTRDPEAINKALGVKVSCSEEGDGWEIRNHSWTGPILTIETRSDRNHLGIIVVNYENQES